MTNQVHYGFGSIEQFRTCVKVVRDRSDYIKIKPPVLNFHGAVKLHGTNASVVFSSLTDEMYPQSRENVISILKDNAGFAAFVETQKNEFTELFKKIAQSQNNDLEKIIIFGEWCGGNIQKGVALNKLPKMFVIFGVQLIGTTETNWFSPKEIKSLGSSERIKNIEESKTFEVQVDFEKPEIAQNHFVELTKQVEQECPFASELGQVGIGEGLVWTCTTSHETIKTNDLKFKTKGEKHSDTKTKIIVEVDAAKIESIRLFVDQVTTTVRLEKMLEKMSLQGLDYLDVKNTGEFLKLVNADVLKEEIDVVNASGFVWKDITGPLNRKAREWFMQRLDHDILH